MRLSTLMSAVILAFGLALSPSAEATTAVYLEVDEHAERSTAVVRATLGEQYYALHPTWGRPTTITKVHVDEVLAGAAPNAFTIEQIGGVWGGEMLHVAGDAELKTGDQVVLFVRDTGDAHWYLTAMEQSLYQVVPSVDGLALERELGDGLLLRAPEGGFKKFEPRNESSLTLDELRGTLKSVTVDGGDE